MPATTEEFESYCKTSECSARNSLVLNTVGCIDGSLDSGLLRTVQPVMQGLPSGIGLAGFVAAKKLTEKIHKFLRLYSFRRPYGQHVRREGLSWVHF